MIAHPSRDHYAYIAGWCVALTYMAIVQCTVSIDECDWNLWDFSYLFDDRAAAGPGCRR